MNPAPDSSAFGANPSVFGADLARHVLMDLPEQVSLHDLQTSVGVFGQEYVTNQSLEGAQPLLQGEAGREN